MGEVYIDSYEELERMKQEFEAGKKKEDPEIRKEVGELYAKEFYKRVKKVCAQVIDEWYSSYTPLYPDYYKRTKSLKNAIKIERKGTSVYVYGETDALAGHRLDSEKLYNLTMEKGSHGGPMYRGPLGYWTHPTRPAVVTFAPVDVISAWIKNYEPEENIKKKAEAIARKHYSKYEYFRLFF